MKPSTVTTQVADPGHWPCPGVSPHFGTSPALSPHGMGGESFLPFPLEQPSEVVGENFLKFDIEHTCKVTWLTTAGTQQMLAIITSIILTIAIIFIMQMTHHNCKATHRQKRRKGKTYTPILKEAIH